MMELPIEVRICRHSNNIRTVAELNWPSGETCPYADKQGYCIRDFLRAPCDAHEAVLQWKG